MTMTWNEFWPPVRLSLQVALLSSILALLFGLAASWLLSRKRRRKGTTLLETLFMLPLVLPPTVVGFLLLVALGRKGWAGRLFELLFSVPIVFSWGAAVVASTVVAFPLVYQTVKVGLASVDRDVEDAARSAGAGEGQVFWHITLPLVSPSLFTAYILGFARSLGEFGATLMIAGNIPGRTQTLPTAIYVAVDAGHTAMAWAWTGSIIVISFLMLLLTGRKKAS